VKSASENENWRTKYLDNLDQLENERRRFKTLETTLRRLAGRLCTASLGQSSQLDEQIRKLQNAIRRDATSVELDQITPALTDAIQALDQLTSTPSLIPATPVASPAFAVATAPQSPAPAAACVNGSIRAALANLLTELRRDAELIQAADAIDSKLTASMSSDQLAEIVSSLTPLVTQRIERIERAKQEVEVLLSHMVGKLDEIGRFVADQSRSQSESQASSETLNVQLAGEMKAMGETVEASGDLQQIRTQVRSRLDSIDQHLREFRQRQNTLAAAMQTRNEQMRSRIMDLEAEASRLQSQLQDEQRLATIDALTKIPNRLAYERRVDEEVKRWQRFKQPTSLAVWDVDHFKRINDTYGHRAGDRVLGAVAECLTRRIRNTDFLARYGGEELVMILTGTRVSDAVKLIDELRVAVSNIGFHFRGTPVSITISIGVTELSNGDSAGTVFDRADKALYQAKQGGRNRCSRM
jgi:diguanylate cyclase